MTEARRCHLRMRKSLSSYCRKELWRVEQALRGQDFYLRAAKLVVRGLESETFTSTIWLSTVSQDLI